ncbi:lipocalin family protein [Biformimicrobium ophioploci]|uniref:lipocalin family protein n=1 Tax=Biformimicrobium ophioploci TaxID=3036711 RepID=UPI0025576E05|nr:lipocalin family protein [Microbulbifer sp. NKW57]
MSLIRTSRLVLAIAFAATLAGCTGVPAGVEPVRDFELDRYLGQWYEIARLDHRFERGMSRVTAEYSRKPDGSVKVINRGYLADEGRWKEAEGKARFAGDPSVGHLEVSFFGPFYGSYVVFELEREGYQYAFVTSSSRSYLWLLARTPQVPDAVRDQFLQRAGQLGFDLEQLIWVKQPR